MKKVEVYFLINLGAILSLFAIEGELAVYMSRQDDILKNVMLSPQNRFVVPQLSLFVFLKA